MLPKHALYQAELHPDVPVSPGCHVASHRSLTLGRSRRLVALAGLQGHSPASVVVDVANYDGPLTKELLLYIRVSTNE